MHSYASVSPAIAPLLLALGRALRDGDKGKLQTGFVSLTSTQDLLLWLLDGANGFVRFTLLLERKIFSIPVTGKYTGELYLGNLPIAAY